VVISIVAVLLAITMPSFQHAREVSQQLKCRANMRAVTQGAQFYAGDNRGFGPPTTQNNPYQWHRPTTSSYTDTRGRVCPPVRGMASYFGYEDDVPANNRRFYYGSLGCPQYKNEGTVGI